MKAEKVSGHIRGYATAIEPGMPCEVCKQIIMPGYGYAVTVANWAVCEFCEADWINEKEGPEPDDYGASEEGLSDEEREEMIADFGDGDEHACLDNGYE